MKISIFTIQKEQKSDIFEDAQTHFIKSSKRFADIYLYSIFSKKIAHLHKSDPSLASKAYTEEIGKQKIVGKTIALDPNAKAVDSENFANLLKDSASVNFFIGGAYGFESDFLDKCNHTVSFGKITLSHRLAKVVLLEQIYRALTILHNHPYHK